MRMVPSINYCTYVWCVVDETNYQTFLDNKIQVCLPRNVDPTIQSNNKFFIAYSLQELFKMNLLIIDRGL